MKKVGLVTFYDENFGSILQCYATKKLLEENNYECVVLFEISEISKKKSKFKIKINNAINLLRNCILDPKYLKRWKKYRKVPVALTDLTHKQMHDFVKEHISPIGVPIEKLKYLGLDVSFDAFIVGSDQVWNVNNENSSIYRLEFAPKKKRIAYAVSLGADKLNRKNLKKIKRNVINFDKISVREVSGKNIINSVSDVKVDLAPDPTLFFNKYEWRKIYGDIEIAEKDYILVHFLNHPNAVAIDTINRIQKSMSISVICIGYRYDIFEKFGWIYLDCNPFEYVAYIDKSSFVCTDSFHTTLFSINFGKNFYTFERVYMHGSPQTGRIKNLLNYYKLSDRFIIESVNEANIIDLSYLNLLDKERYFGRSYILNSLACIEGFSE